MADEIDVNEVLENIEKKYGYDRRSAYAYVAGWIWTNYPEDQKKRLLEFSQEPIEATDVTDEGQIDDGFRHNRIQNKLP